MFTISAWTFTESVSCGVCSPAEGIMISVRSLQRSEGHVS